ncbi:hypothetical protein WDW89_05290 [Deltaproteobacteria bacterium TL4]
MKQFLLSLLLLSLAFTGVAQETVSRGTSVYGTALSYENSASKESAQATGVYLYVGYGLQHSFEGALDYIRIQNQTPPHLKQLDYTAVYTNYSLVSWKLRTGIHYIESTHDATNGGTVLMLGANYYRPYQWNIGLDYYQSVYPF